MSIQQQHPGDTVTYVPTTVSIPVDRLSEFHKMFANWLDHVSEAQSRTDESEISPGLQTKLPSHWPEAAEDFWLSLNARERAFLGRLADAVPGGVDPTELAEHMGLESGPAGIRGCINRLCRKAPEAGFFCGWDGPSQLNAPLYALRDFGTGARDYDTVVCTKREYAELLRNARDAVEGAG